MDGIIGQFHLMRIRAILVFIILILTGELTHAEPMRLSHWSADGDDGSLYSLSIWQDGAHLTVSYTFTYFSGRKTNTSTWRDDDFTLHPLENDCFQSTLFDDHEPEGTGVEVVMCPRGEVLYFMKLDFESAYYIPDYVRFKRIDGN